jgi:hypothetical protein
MLCLRPPHDLHVVVSFLRCVIVAAFDSLFDSLRIRGTSRRRTTIAGSRATWGRSCDAVRSLNRRAYPSEVARREAHAEAGLRFCLRSRI